MAIQTIKIGSYANDGSGDDLRTAFTKVNANFALLGTDIPVAEAVNLNTNILTILNVGSTVGSNPYIVTFNITPVAVAPATNVYYYISGNTNPLYNGHFFCTTSGLNTISVRYLTNPGIFVATTPTIASTAVGIFKDKNSNVLEFNSITSSDNSVNIIPGTNTIDIRSGQGVINDTAPKLGGDLDLVGHRIFNSGSAGGDIQSTVYGIRVDILNSVVGLLLQNNIFTIDFGRVVGNYSTINLDLGLVPYAINNGLDFGQF